MIPRQALMEAVKTRVLLADGAMGTQLQLAGIEAGACGESWNLAHPEKILAIQRAYAEAGSDCLITNSFGGSRTTLKRHGLADQTYAMNRAAAQLARQALGGCGWVLGDVGPFGGFLEPLGETTEDELMEILSEQIQGLLDGGADAIICETQTAIEEARVGIRAAKKLGAPCVIASFAFDRVIDGFRTMMGVSPKDVVARLEDLGVDIFAANCGTGIDIEGYVRIMGEYREATDRPLMAQPNAGKPSMEAGQVIYRETPQFMAGHLPELIEAGATIVGGCCGTTPEHIRLYRQVIDQIAGRNP
jgi:5-methyltetrahydrofolate--homocysteine methyltransferase